MVMGVDVGMKNLAICVLNCDTGHVVFMDVLDIFAQRSVLHMSAPEPKNAEKKRKKKYASIYELVTGVIGTLENVLVYEPCLYHLSHCIIESQTPYHLPHMKNISTAIHTFLKTRIPNLTVQYMNAMSKFEGHGIPKKEISKYKDRKKLAVECARKHLEKMQDVAAITQFVLYKKQDDLADAYLLALRGYK